LNNCIINHIANIIDIYYYPDIQRVVIKMLCFVVFITVDMFILE